VRLRGYRGAMYMKTTRLFCLACALALASPLPAAAAPADRVDTGTIEGRVVDDATGQPVGRVLLRIAQLGRGELSHADGTFHFHALPVGEHTITATRVGYAPAELRVRVADGVSARVELRLRASVLELAPVVVTGTTGERRSDDVLSPTTVVSGARLERQMAGTVAETVEHTPGVAVTSIGPATSRPVIRGLSADRVLVLEDGQRPGDLSSTSGDHAVAIEAVTARRIEVVRGPMSLLYGSSALGGVVNVVRDEVPTTRSEHPHGTGTVLMNSVDRSATLGAYTTAGGGPYALRAELSARTSSDVHTPLGPLPNTDARTLGFSGGGSYVGAWGHAGASYRYYDNRYGIPGGFLGAHPGGVDIELRRHAVRAEAERHPAGGAFTALRGTATFVDYVHREYEAAGVIGTEFFQQLATLEAAARHDAWGPLSQGAFGVRAQYRDILTGGSLRTPSTYDWTVAGYVVEELGTGRLRGQGGARYDFARFVPREQTTITIGGREVPVRPRTFGSVSGSLGGLYDLGGGVRVGASLARSYRTPDFNELYSNGPHLAAGTFDVGDPDLRQEVGMGLDAFVRVTRPRLRAEAAAYANRLAGYIHPSTRGRVEQGTSGDVPRAQFTNEDALFTGVEGEAEWNVRGGWTVEGTTSYVRARFTSERAPIPVITATDTTWVAASRYPPLIPPLIGRVGGRWEQGPWLAAAGVRFAAGQPRLGDFEEPTAGYAVGDLSLGVRVVRGARVHAVSLRFENVADTEYRDHLARTKQIMPQPGRGVSLLYRLTY
jgi:iron complex outermembrane recepter protein